MKTNFFKLRRLMLFLVVVNHICLHKNQG